MKETGPEQGTSLKDAVRASEEYKALKVMFSGVDYISDLEAFGGLAEPARNRQADKAKILQALEAYKQRYEDESQESAIKRFVRDYNDKLIEPRQDIHSRIKSLSRASLMRWKQQVRFSGWASLAGSYKPREGFFEKHPQALEILLLLKSDFPKASNVAIYKVLAAELEKAGIPLISQRTVDKALKRLKEDMNNNSV